MQFLGDVWKRDIKKWLSDPRDSRDFPSDPEGEEKLDPETFCTWLLEFLCGPNPVKFLDTVTEVHRYFYKHFFSNVFQACGKSTVCTRYWSIPQLVYTCKDCRKDPTWYECFLVFHPVYCFVSALYVSIVSKEETMWGMITK